MLSARPARFVFPQIYLAKKGKLSEIVQPFQKFHRFFKKAGAGSTQSNTVKGSDYVLKQTLRSIHGSRFGLDRTDYRRSAKQITPVIQGILKGGEAPLRALLLLFLQGKSRPPAGEKKGVEKISFVAYNIPT